MARTRVIGVGTMRSTATIIGVFALVSTSAARAQEPVAQKPPPRDTVAIPERARPPVGMCRIWLNDVPVAQQPAPTDCTSAVRNKPAKGRVLFGDDYVKGESTSKSLPFVKGFTPATPKLKSSSVKRDTTRP